MARRAAAAVAMLGMAVSILIGLWSQNPAAVILERSIYTMLVCFVAAGLAGLIAERVVAEHIRQREKTVFDALPPLPPEPEPDATAEEDEEEPLVVGGGELGGR